MEGEPWLATCDCQATKHALERDTSILANESILQSAQLARVATVTYVDMLRPSIHARQLLLYTPTHVRWFDAFMVFVEKTTEPTETTLFD